MSQLFASVGQSIGASASVLPVNIQSWFPLELTGWISMLSMGHSRIFSNTTIGKHQFFGAQPSLWSILTSTHDYWKNHSFDYMDLCWHSAFFMVHMTTGKTIALTIQTFFGKERFLLFNTLSRFLIAFFQGPSIF